MNPKEWFESQYVFTENDKDIVSMKEMIEEFRPFHRTINRGHLTKKVFLEICTLNAPLLFEKHFHGRKKINQVDYRSVFMGIKKR
jgi:hypothetical protein